MWGREGEGMTGGGAGSTGSAKFQKFNFTKKKLCTIDDITQNNFA